MKLQFSKLALLIGTPVVLLAYQNCAKLGTENFLGGNSAFVTSGSTEIASTQSSADAADEAFSPTTKEDPNLLADAVKACREPASLSAPAVNPNLNVNRDVIKLDAYQVAGIQGGHSEYVLIRGVAGGALTVGDVNIEKTTLVLCGFKSVESIKGSKNTVIIVAPEGGTTEVGQVGGRQNEYLFVNAMAEKISQPAHIKYYSLN